MAVSITIWPLAADRFRLRCRIARKKDTYRFVRGTRAEAEAERLRWLAEVQTYGRPPVEPTTRLRAWFDHLFIVDGLRLQPRTLAEYRRLIDRHLGWLGAVPLNRLTPADGINFQRDLIESKSGRDKRRVRPEDRRSLDPATVRKVVKLIKWAAKAAADQRVIASDPLLAVRPIAVPGRDVELPPTDQLHRLGEVEGRTGLLLRLLAHAALRRGEALALRWRDIDFTAGTLTVAGSLERDADGGLRVKAPKTRAGRRTIGLAPDMLAELRAARAALGVAALAAGAGLGERPVIAGDDGGHWSPDAASQAGRRALAKLGLPGSLHTLRHLHATVLMAGRVNPKAVAARLGHASVATTMAYYAHVLPQDDAAAIAAIERTLPTGGKTPALFGG